MPKVKSGIVFEKTNKERKKLKESNNIRYK